MRSLHIGHHFFLPSTTVIVSLCNNSFSNSVSFFTKSSISLTLQPWFSMQTTAEQILVRFPIHHRRNDFHSWFIPKTPRKSSSQIDNFKSVVKYTMGSRWNLALQQIYFNGIGPQLPVAPDTENATVYTITSKPYSLRHILQLLRHSEPRPSHPRLQLWYTPLTHLSLAHVHMPQPHTKITYLRVKCLLRSREFPVRAPLWHERFISK